MNKGGVKPGIFINFFELQSLVLCVIALAMLEIGQGSFNGFAQQCHRHVGIVQQRAHSIRDVPAHHPELAVKSIHIGNQSRHIQVGF